MPESTCLHIQDRESGPIRVVELPWISVRIGRAAYCEVRLPDDQRRRGSLPPHAQGTRPGASIPAAGPGLILFEGRPLRAPVPCPSTSRSASGPYCLTLRHDVAAEPDWEMYPASAPSGQLVRGRSAVGPGSTRRRRLRPHLPGRALAHAPAAPVPRRRHAESAPTPDRWRARWKAAEAHFKARDARLGAGSPTRCVFHSRRMPRENPIRPVSRPRRRPRRRSSRRPRPGADAGHPRIEPTWRCPVRNLTARRRASVRRYGRSPRPRARTADHEAIDAPAGREFPRCPTPSGRTGRRRRSRARSERRRRADLARASDDGSTVVGDRRARHRFASRRRVRRASVLSDAAVERDSASPADASSQPKPPGRSPSRGEPAPTDEPAPRTRPAESGAAAPGAGRLSTAGRAASAAQPADRSRARGQTRSRRANASAADAGPSPRRRFRPDDESADVRRSASGGRRAGPGDRNAVGPGHPGESPQQPRPAAGRRATPQGQSGGPDGAA